MCEVTSPFTYAKFDHSCTHWHMLQHATRRRRAWLLAGFHNQLGSVNWQSDWRVQYKTEELDVYIHLTFITKTCDCGWFVIPASQSFNGKPKRSHTPQCNLASRLPLHKSLSNNAELHIMHSHKHFGPWPVINLCCWVRSHDFSFSQNATPWEV